MNDPRLLLLPLTYQHQVLFTSQQTWSFTPLLCLSHQHLSDHCNSPFTNFPASDFGPIHLYVTVFLHVAIRSKFSNLYMMMSSPHLLPKENLNALEQTRGHIELSMSDLAFLPSSFHQYFLLYIFSFQCSHNSTHTRQFSHTSFQVIILLP